MDPDPAERGSSGTQSFASALASMPAALVFRVSGLGVCEFGGLGTKQIQVLVYIAGLRFWGSGFKILRGVGFGVQDIAGFEFGIILRILGLWVRIVRVQNLRLWLGQIGV